MSHEQDRLWSAYIDGELPAREAADLHESISPEDRERLGLECHLEKELIRPIEAGSECPPEVWLRVKDRIEDRAGRGWLSRVIRRRRVWFMAASILAASALVVLGTYHLSRDDTHGNILEIARDVRALGREVEVQGNVEKVRQFMAAQGVDLPLRMPPLAAQTGVHRARLLGARKVRHHDGDGVELLFDCCGEPLKLILAPLGSALARTLEVAQGEGQVQTSRTIGGFLVAAVGRHDASAVMMMLG